MTKFTSEQSWFPHFLFTSRESAPFWFVVRLYVGYEWLIAGIDKVMNPAWFGSGAGASIKGFVAGALRKTAEFCKPDVACHPDVQMWYASFLKDAVLPYPATWSNAIAVGEVLVGVGLIVGAIVGVAAFFGALMNLNFMLAGTVSINPILFTLSIGLILAWRVAGYWGLDRYVLPRLHSRSKLYGSSSA
jgi:thiosulfate dehydrogenase [quinone] large subunit